MNLLNSPSGYGWYCKINRLEPRPKRINEGSGELFHRIKNFDEAMTAFKNAIIGFGGSKEDFDNIIKHSNNSYHIKFNSEIIV